MNTRFGNNPQGQRALSRHACVLAILLAALGPLSGAELEVKTLAIKPVHQEHAMWCWAACAEMVIEFLKPNVNAKQCELAQLQFAFDCCGTSNDFEEECNTSGTFPFVPFRENGIHFERTSSTAANEQLVWREIKRQIDAGQPILYAYRLNERSVSGHMVVIYGYGRVRNKRVLCCIDPNAVATEPYMLFYDKYRAQAPNHWDTWYELK